MYNLRVREMQQFEEAAALVGFVWTFNYKKSPLNKQ